MREALIVWGGWSGHEPEQCAGIISDMLEADGFRVRVENSTAAFADPSIKISASSSRLHHGEIEKRGAEPDQAVEGVGLAGYHAAGRAFRERLNTSSCRRPMGRPPGNIIDYRVESRGRRSDPGGNRELPYRSEQYYIMSTPQTGVATPTFSASTPIGSMASSSGRLKRRTARAAFLFLARPLAKGSRFRRCEHLHRGMLGQQRRMHEVIAEARWHWRAPGCERRSANVEQQRSFLAMASGEGFAIMPCNTPSG